MRELISRSLVKDPAGRLPDGAAFAAAIDDIVAGRPLAPAPPTVAVPAPRSVARPPATRHRNRVVMVLLPVLGLLAGAGIAVALLLALTDDTPPGSPAEAAEQRQTGSIVLDAGDYVGRPVDDVTQRLTSLGLRVRLESEVRDDVVPNQVTGVEPDGRSLEPGDTVVVTYAVAQAGDGAQRDGTVVTGAVVGGGSSAADESGSAVDGDPHRPGRRRGGDHHDAARDADGVAADRDVDVLDRDDDVEQRDHHDVDVDEHGAPAPGAVGESRRGSPGRRRGKITEVPDGPGRQ